MKGRIVYIAGPITGRPKEEYMEQFDRFQRVLERDCGKLVINPARILDPLEGLDHDEFMVICKAMVDIADLVVMLPGWKKSKGASMEYEYAMSRGKLVLEDEHSILKTIIEMMKGETDEQRSKARSEEPQDTPNTNA